MNEVERAKRFERDLMAKTSQDGVGREKRPNLDSLLSGKDVCDEGAPAGESPPENNQDLLVLACSLVSQPFEPDRERQAALRQHLIALHGAGLPARQREQARRQRWMPLLQAAGWVALIVLFALGLNWILGTLPGSQTPGTGPEPALRPTGMPASQGTSAWGDEYLQEQEAAQLALETASSPRPGLSAADGAPSISHMDWLPFAEALLRLTGSSQAPAGADPEKFVWLVEMQGTWKDLSPPPSGQPTQYYSCYAVILDAKTGETLSVSAGVCPLSSPAHTAEPTADLLSLPTESPYSGALSLQSPHQAIRERMIRPAWETLWVEGQLTYFSADEQPDQAVYVQAWLGRDGRGRVIVTDQQPYDSLSSSRTLVPRWVWVSQDGLVTAGDASTGEIGPAAVQAGVISHPLENVHPVVEMLFPHTLTLHSQAVEVIGEDQVAGRPALVVDWAYARYWVDVETGVLLRTQPLSDSGSAPFQIDLYQVVFNLPIPEEVTDPASLAGISFEQPPR
jgi:hypothetical protein